MFNPDLSGHRAAAPRRGERAASLLKVSIRFFPVRAIGNLPETFKEMLAWRPDGALWILGQQQAFQTGSIELAASQRLPLMVGSRQNVEAGGLISYSFDPVEQYRRTAKSVDRILKGAKPGDLPIEQPTKFELAINLEDGERTRARYSAAAAHTGRSRC